MSICSQTSHCVLTSIGCFIYNFQTLLTGLAAITVAFIAGIPVWRQLKDTNLQTRISHRETLATLLRDALRRYARVEKSIREPLTTASRVTSDPIGEPEDIDGHDAHHLEGLFHGVLDWYLVVLADTEHSDIEAAKAALKVELDRLMATLSEAYWAEANEQRDEDHNFSNEEWAEICHRSDEAKTEVYARVGDVERTYRLLGEAQQLWVQSLRRQIARLDQQIVGPR